MRVLPVLDLMSGQVVRGVAGRRETYRPINSVLTSSSQPLEVVEAIENKLDLSQFYLADLDAIQFSRPQRGIIEQISRAFPGSWLDSGIRTPRDVRDFAETDALVFVVGLETVEGPQILRELCDEFGPERIVFSLDMKAGMPLGNLSPWQSASPFEIAAEAIALGVRQLLLLDLAQVGVSEGVSTIPLCKQIQNDFPEIQITTGGGIRHREDLLLLKESRVHGALVASAFHSGQIGREDLLDLDEPAS